MRRSDLVQHKEREKGASTRTSQIVFGERQHLSPRSRFARGHAVADRANATRAAHSGGIDSRAHTRFESINTAWDEKIGLVLSSDAKRKCWKNW